MSTAVPAQASIKIGQANMNQSRAKAMSDVNKKRGGFDYIINSMMLVCIVGLSIKIFFTTPPSTDGLTGPANAVIYGYAIVALAILVVRFISYGIHDRISTIENRGNNANDQGGMMGKLKNVVGFVKSFIISMGPSLFVLFILCWNIYLNIHYYTKINKGMVADEFFKLVMYCSKFSLKWSRILKYSTKSKFSNSFFDIFIMRSLKYLLFANLTSFINSVFA